MQYPQKLSIGITAEQYEELKKFPHGSKQRIFHKLIDQLIALVKEAPYNLTFIEQDVLSIGKDDRAKVLALLNKGE